MLMRTHLEVTLYMYCIPRQMKSPFDGNIVMATTLTYKVTRRYSQQDQNRDVIPIYKLSLLYENI